MLITLLLYVPSPRGWECFVPCRCSRRSGRKKSSGIGSARRLLDLDLSRILFLVREDFKEDFKSRCVIETAYLDDGTARLYAYL